MDLVLAENDDPDIVKLTADNCYNSSDIGFNLIFTTASLTGGALTTGPWLTTSLVTLTALLAATAWAIL